MIIFLGSHLNPAVSLFLATFKAITIVDMFCYWLAQFVGAFIGAGLTYLIYYGMFIYLKCFLLLFDLFKSFFQMLLRTLTVEFELFMAQKRQLRFSELFQLKICQYLVDSWINFLEL